MPVEEGTIVIRAPVEFVFSYLSDAANLPLMLQSNMIAEILEVEAQEGGGYRYIWEYNILAKTLRATSETVEFIPPYVFAVKSVGPIETIGRWLLEPVAGGTLARLSVEYKMTSSLLNWLTERFAANQVRYSVEAALLALRTLIHDELKVDSLHVDPGAARAIPEGHRPSRMTL